MPAILHEFRYAVRQLLKAPGFATLAVLTLALGIGANTAMFTVVENVLLRPLPYTQSDRIVYIGPADTKGFGSTSWLNYSDIRDQQQSFALLSGYSDDLGVVQGNHGSVSAATAGVTPNVFTMLSSQPLMGRTFTEEEGQRGGPQVVLLSEGLWKNSFGADPKIINQTVRVNGRPRIVVGVMPRNFRFPESMGQIIEEGVWLPLQPNPVMLKERGYDFLKIVGELKPETTLAQAQAELRGVARHIRQSDPGANRDLEFHATPYQDMLTARVRPAFHGLVLALALVLLIACVNVSLLMIVRYMARRQEFALRAALGAGWKRLVRQVVIEAGIVIVAASGVGFGLAYLAVTIVHKLPPDTIPRVDGITMRSTVVLILAAIAAIATLLSAVFPAFLVARTHPQTALQSAQHGIGRRQVRGHLSAWLVGGEVALSALLLIATGLLFRTLRNLERTHLGFEITQATTLFTAMPEDAAGFGNMDVSQDPGHAPPSIAAVVYQPVLEQMRRVAGVKSVALVTAPPLSGIDLHTSFRIVGDPVDAAHVFEARMTAVSGGFADVMGTPTVRGRTISDDDDATSPYVATINETLTRKYFGDKDPLGRQIDLGGKETGMLKPYTIVGVIGDQVDSSVSQPPQPLLMLSYLQVPATSVYYAGLLKTVMSFGVRTRADIAVAPSMRSVFQQRAPGFALDNFETIQQIVAHSNFNQKLGLYLTGAFAGMATLMVVAGLYGVLAQLVSYRRHEFGVRLALGATRRNILCMVLWRGAALIFGGLAAGILLAILMTGLMENFLYGVPPLDLWTYAGVALLLVAVGILASLIPAQRAAAVDPMNALREE